MVFLSQRDSRWAEEKLGASYLTVGRYGCTTTAISMLSDYFDCYKSPSEIAANVNNYTKGDNGGLVIWNRLKFDKMKWMYREYGHDDAEIRRALEDPDRGVILEVNNKSHWVVAYSKRFGRIRVLDPIDGRIRNLSYYRNVTGAAYFRRKQTNEPVVQLDPEFGKKLSGWDYPFFMQIDERGELWYIHPDGEREYLSPDNILKFIERHAEGISNVDLTKIKIKK